MPLRLLFVPLCVLLNLSMSVNASEHTVLEQVRIVDVQAGLLIEGEQDIHIVDGVITHIAPSGTSPIPADAHVIPGQGQYLIPGLWDAHVHLYHYGPQIGSILLRHGITSVRDMGGVMEKLAPLLDQLKHSSASPTIYASMGIVESAQWIERAAQYTQDSGDKAGADDLRARLAVRDESSAKASVAALKEANADFVKIRSFASPESFVALGEAASAANLKIAGHAPTNMSPSDAVRSGLSSIEHGLIALAFMDEDARDEELANLTDAMLEHNAVLCPTTTANKYLTLGLDNLTHQLDALDADDSRGLSDDLLAKWRRSGPMNIRQGPDWNRVVPAMYDYTRQLHRNGVTLIIGTDSGSIPLTFPGQTLHDELERVVDILGLTPAEAIRGATLATAQWVGVSDRVGLVQEGYQADLVLLTENPLSNIAATRSINLVLKAGQVVWQKN